MRTIESMDTTIHPEQLPDPEFVRGQIGSVEEELKALRRLLRACVSARKAGEARKRRQAPPEEGGALHVS
jgi:hypothetical protein